MSDEREQDGAVPSRNQLVARPPNDARGTSTSAIAAATRSKFGGKCPQAFGPKMSGA